MDVAKEKAGFGQAGASFSRADCDGGEEDIASTTQEFADQMVKGKVSVCQERPIGDCLAPSKIARRTDRPDRRVPRVVDCAEATFTGVVEDVCARYKCVAGLMCVVTTSVLRERLRHQSSFQRLNAQSS